MEFERRIHFIKSLDDKQFLSFAQQHLAFAVVVKTLAKETKSGPDQVLEFLDYQVNDITDNIELSRLRERFINTFSDTELNFLKWYGETVDQLTEEVNSETD